MDARRRDADGKRKRRTPLRRCLTTELLDVARLISRRQACNKGPSTVAPTPGVREHSEPPPSGDIGGKRVTGGRRRTEPPRRVSTTSGTSPLKSSPRS